MQLVYDFSYVNIKKMMYTIINRKKIRTLPTKCTDNDDFIRKWIFFGYFTNEIRNNVVEITWSKQCGRNNVVETMRSK